jgi:hypothetical protein
MAIVRVNNVKAINTASATTLAAPSITSVTGNLIVVLARSGTITGGTNGDEVISDSQSNTYTRIGAILGNGGLGEASLWYAKNITGGANVVTCTYVQAVSYRGIIVVEYSGLDTTSPLDAAPTPVNLSGTGTSTSNSFTTTSANEVIVLASAYDAGSAATAGLIGGVTATLVEDNSGDSCYEDLIVSSIQTGITAAISSNGSGDWLSFTASFKAASGVAVTYKSPSMSMMGVGV